MLQVWEQKFTRDFNPLNWKNFPVSLSTTWIFSKESCNDVSASRALINFISEVISQTELFRDCFYGFLSLTIITKHSILDVGAALDPSLYISCSYLKLAQFTGMKLLTIFVMTSNHRDITLRRAVLKVFLIFTVP